MRTLSKQLIVALLVVAGGTARSGAQSSADAVRHPYLYDTVWDVMRLIDYLATRPDVDAARIGVVGNSKGGTEAYLAARFLLEVDAAHEVTSEAQAATLEWLTRWLMPSRRS